jgi:hypothetical protein
MKPQDLTTMKANATTLILCTTLTLMDVDHQRIGRRIMGHPHNKQTRGPPTRDLINTAKAIDQQTGATVVVEARIQLDLCTACTTVMRQTIAPKIVPSS